MVMELNKVKKYVRNFIFTDNIIIDSHFVINIRYGLELMLFCVGSYH